MVSPLYDCFTSFNFKADHMMHLLQNLAKNVTMCVGAHAQPSVHVECVRAAAQHSPMGPTARRSSQASPMRRYDETLPPELPPPRPIPENVTDD